jgi:hypothetical protein
MKRDPGLIRELLLKLEVLPMRPGGIVHITPGSEEIGVPGYGTAQIEYHLSYLLKAGFIDNGGVRPMEGIGFRSLTPAGHEYLDRVRDPAMPEWKHGGDPPSIVTRAPTADRQRAAVFTLKPGIWGMSVDLKAAWARLRSWLQRQGSQP